MIIRHWPILTAFSFILSACGDAAREPDAESAAALPAEEPASTELWRSLAEEDLNTVIGLAGDGDRVAQYELGIRLSEGRGVDRDPLEAVDWFRFAAEQGFPQAQFEMGSAYLTGEGARPSIEEATRWYREAAAGMEEGAVFADYLEDVREGNTDEPDDALRQAMWLHFDGDETGALEKFVPLAESGNAMAAYYAGMIERDRADVDVSPEDLYAEAIAWYRQAAEAGFVWAQLDLAEIHLERSFAGADDPAEAAEALRWYRAAAEQGSDAGEAGVELVTAREAPTSPAASDASPTDQPPASADGRSDLQICGRMWGQWQWSTTTTPGVAIPGVLTFDMNNNVGAAPSAGAPQVLFGTWSCDPATAAFKITWQNDVIENYTMATDGSSISGQNNLGMPVRGTPLR